MIKDSSFPAKLILAFGVLIAIVVCIGVIGLRHLQADAELERIVDARWEKVQLSRQAQSYSNLNNRITMQVFLVENENDVYSLLAETAKNSEKISGLIDTLRTRIEAPEELQLLDAIEQTRTPYLESYRRALRLLVNDKRPAEARAILTQEALPLLLKYHDSWNSYATYQGAQLDRAQERTSAINTQTRLQAFVLISVVVILAIFIAYFVTRNLTKLMARRKRAEDALRRSHDELEARVSERTLELASANSGLKREIAEKRLIEAALRDSEERYRQIVECANDTIYRISPTGYFTFVNSSAAALIRRSETECVGLHFTELIREDYREKTLAFYAQQIEDKVPITYFEFPAIAKDGTEVWIGQNVQLVAENGRVIELQGIARDITTQREIEQQLLESERHYRLLFESNPLSMWVFDVETLRFLAVNDAAVRHYGYSREEFLEMTIKDVRPPEDVDHLMSALTTSVGDIGNVSGISRHRKKDGSVIDVEVGWHKLNFSGKAAKLVLANDVTERKRAEQEILVQKARFQQLFENTPMGIVVVDENDIVLDANKEFEDIFGFSLSEVRGQHINERIVPGDQDQEGAELSAKTLQGEAIEKETVRQRRDGTLIPVQVYGVPIIANQKTVGVFAIYVDLSQRKRMEAEREIIAEIIQGAITTSDLDEFLRLAHQAIGKYLYADNCFVALYDETTELMHFPFWVDKLDPCPEPRPVGIGFSSYVLRTGKPILVDRELTEEMYQRGEVQKSGSASASWLGVPLRTPSRIIGVLVVQNYEEENAYDERDQEFLTSVGSQIALAIERKRAETNLREAEDRLRQSQKMESIGNLAGGIAHDFNNLMTAVTGYSELALRSAKLDDSLRFKVEEIKKAGERAASLTRQLLAFSRKQMLQPKMLDLNAVVTGMGRMLTRVISEDIDLHFRLDDSLGQIKADPGQIEQVLLNLAVNARDAMPDGGTLSIKTENVHLNGKLTQSQFVTEPGHYVMMSVSDTGCGMDAETKSHIFEPFFTTKEVGKGTGLGLATVYGIVKQSGGNIWVYSELGKGTIFKIYLPRVDEIVDEDTNDSESKAAMRGKETILLVEDEEIVRNLACEILQTYGYSVLTGANGSEGLRIGREFEGPIDLVITDVIMPLMNGREMAEKLREIRPHIGVIFMSGFTDDAIVHHGVLDESMFFIQKPFSPDALGAMARQVLDQVSDNKFPAGGIPNTPSRVLVPESPHSVN